MAWKDVGMKGKFTVSFGVILALIVVVGGWSVLGIGSIVNNAGQVIDGNKLRGEFTQRIVDHLNWVSSLNRFLVDEKVNELTIQLDPRKCGFGKWYYGEGRQQAEALVPALGPIMAGVEQPHIHLHESASKIKNQYVTVDPHLGEFLAQKKVDHLNWVGKVRDALLEKGVTSINVQKDWTKCGMGKWLYSEETTQHRRSDPSFAAVVDPLYKPHEELHKSTIALEGFLKEDNLQGALAFFQKDTLGSMRDVLGGLDKVIAWQGDRMQSYQAALNTYNTETLPSLEQVKKFLDQGKATVNTNIMTDEEMLSDADKRRLVVLVLSAVALVLGIIFAVVMVRGILGPLGRGVGMCNRLAEGDLTADCDINQKDEVGRLVTALRGLAGRLRETIGGVRLASEQVAAGSEELSASAGTLSEGATEQAASVEEISSSMEEMTSNIKQSAENAKHTETLVTGAAQEAESGGDAVNRTVAAMKEIAEKITIVEEIARQTNLLALNAAIEAARAGEAGKGFAVVAAEVRKLAERSGNAAGEITQLATSSVAVADEAGRMLAKMVPDIKKTAELVQEIAAASNEQNIGADQINKAIQQLDQVIQQNASASEEAASTSEELAAQAQSLQEGISFFRTGEHTAIPVRPKALPPSPRPTSASNETKTMTTAGTAKGVALDMDEDADDEFERF